MATDRLGKCWDRFGGEVGKDCNGCTDRHVGCHSDCEKYKKAKEQHEDFKQMIFEAKGKEMVTYRYKIDKIKRENHKSNWKRKG